MFNHNLLSKLVSRAMMCTVTDRFIITVILLLCLQHKTIAGVFECWNDGDCKADNAVCDKSICACPSKQILSSDGKKCLPMALGFGEPCEENDQCGIMGISYECRDNVCTYSPGWVIYQGTLMKKKKVNEECVSNSDCYDGIDFLSRTCEGNLCVCSTGYYARQDVDCRKIANIDEPCLLNLDCIDDNFCNNGKCVKTVTDDVLDFDEMEYAGEQTEALASCNTDDDCLQMNTHCSALFQQCLCNKNYFLKNGICVLELLNPCLDDTDCNDSFSSCIDDVCTCSGRYIHTPANRKCVKGASAPDFFCSSHDSCAVFGNNFECSENTLKKTCACGSNCKMDDQNICQCSQAGASCLTDEQCDLRIPNSFCGNTGVCVCHDNFVYYEEEFKCFPIIGSKCVLDRDCSKITNSNCIRGKCGCRDNYTMQNSTECIEVSGGIGEKCDNDLQCSGKVENSSCQDGTCDCRVGYLLFNGVCQKIAERIGEFCTIGTACTELGVDVKCRNNYCQCESGKIPSIDGKSCRNTGVRSQVLRALIFMSVVILFL